MENDAETPLNGHEACKMIGCCYEYLLAMARSGKIPHFKIGKRYFFRKKSLEKWLTEQEAKNTR